LAPVQSPGSSHGLSGTARAARKDAFQEPVPAYGLRRFCAGVTVEWTLAAAKAAGFCDGMERG